MRAETEAPKTFLVQVIRRSCFASHFGALELCNLPHFYWTACAEGKKGIMPWLDSRCGDKEMSPLREKINEKKNFEKKHKLGHKEEKLKGSYQNK